MAPDEILIEKIHDYLSDVMLAEERQAFEKELQTNEVLREELAIQQELIYAIRRMAALEQLQAIHAQMMQESASKQSQTETAAEQPPKVVPLRPQQGSTRIIAIFSAVASIAAVLIIGFWVAPLLQKFFDTDKPELAAVTVPEQREFTSPIEGLDVPRHVFEIDAEKANNLQLKSGTQINIPPHAFTHANGKKVEGQVQIAYREFHDGLQVLASGIPLTSNDKPMETAGIFDIQAYQDGKPLRLASTITVRLASFTNEPGYSYFRLASHSANDTDAQPVQWEKIAQLSELIINPHKQAYIDSLRAVYRAEAEEQAQIDFEKRQQQAEEHTLGGWQINAVKSNVVMSWLNTQGMEYIGFYPEQENPEHNQLQWVKAVKWQRANAVAAAFMPIAKVNTPAVSGYFTQINYSPDGQFLLLKSVNNTLLYRANGRLVGNLQLKDAVFTADGKHVLGLSDKRELLCYRTSDGEFVAQYGELYASNAREQNPKATSDNRSTTNYGGQVMSFDVSLDGQRVVTIHSDENAVIWDISGKEISRRKGLPKSWFTEIMFANREGTVLIGKMHDNSVQLLNDRWQYLEKRSKFERPANYDSEGIFDKKWAIVYNAQKMRQPEINGEQINYKEFTQHVFYVNRKQKASPEQNNANQKPTDNVYYMQRKQQESWETVDTIYMAAQERAALYAIAPHGNSAAVLIGNNTLIIWQKTDPSRQVYRLSLEGVSFGEGNDALTMDAALVRFHTYVQPAAPKPKREQPRSLTLDELRKRNLRIAEQKLHLTLAARNYEANHLRIFHITQLGIYHVTRDFQTVEVSFANLNFSFDTERDSLQLFQLAGKQRNVVIPIGKFALNTPSAVSFDASGGHLIGVLPDNTVLVFAAKDFAEWLNRQQWQKSKAPQLVFRQKVDKSEVSYEKLKQLLGES